MRKALLFLTLVVISFCFGIKTSAATEVDEFISEFEEITPEGFLDELEVGRIVEMLGVEGILRRLIAVLSGERSRVLSFFLLLLGVIITSSLVNLVSTELAESVRAVVGILSSVAIFHTISALVNEVFLSLNKINEFFSSFIPISIAITAFGGGESTAVTQGSGMYVTLSLLSRASGTVFSSICSFGLSAALLSPLGGQIVSSLTSAVKSIFTRVLGIFTAVITAAFSLQTLVSSSVDGASMRAARYIASGLIPVVGSTVSGALSTLASGMSYAKGIIGGGGVAVILFFAITPLVILLLFRLALSASIGVSQMLCAECERMLVAYRSALDMSLAVYALSTLVYLFEIIVFIKSGVNLL